MRALVAAAFLMAGCATMPPPTTVRSFSPNLTQLDGSAFDWSATRGQIVLVDIWASWCNACAAELPAFVALQKEWANQGIRYVGINVDADPRAAQAFQRAVGSEELFTLTDRNARLVSTTLHIRQLPTRLLLDRTGAVQTVQDGFMPGDEARIRSAIASMQARP